MPELPSMVEATQLTIYRLSLQGISSRIDDKAKCSIFVFLYISLSSPLISSNRLMKCKTFDYLNRKTDEVGAKYSVAMRHFELK